MTRNILLLCLVACISATLMDQHLALANPNQTNVRTPSAFWKSIADFLAKFNTPPKGSDAIILQTKTSGGPRKTKKDDHHPYMASIYDEVSGKQHQKWNAMETEGGATIRGIEPYRVVHHQNSLPPSTTLEFNIDTIDSLDNMRHVELCLSSNNNQSLMEGSAEGSYRVALLLPYSSEDPPKIILSTYQQQGHVFLELTSAIRSWWNRQLYKAHGKLFLRISREDGATVHLNRPLVIFYYKASDPERAKDKELFNTVRQTLLRNTRDAHMPPRLCNHCVYGERKTPVCQRHTKHNQSPCDLHAYYISMKALNWDNVFIEPKEFQMNYCSGSCIGVLADPIYNATMHAIARAKLLNSLPENETERIPPPYCVPSKLKNIDSMYKDDRGQIVVKKWENIVAEQCGCS